MIEILRDGVWQFAGVLLSVLAIGVAVAIYFLQKQRKEFAFGMLSGRSLLTVAEELARRVVISFDGSPISNIQLVELGFKNSGDRPILATDFERPFTIAFGADSKVLSSDITRQFPSNLGARVVGRDDNVLVEPVLLNPGDYFVAKVLVSVNKFQLHTDVRIIGISELVPLNRGVRLRPGAIRNLATNIAMFLIIGVLMLGFAHWSGSSDTMPTPSIRPPLPPFPSSYALLPIGLALLLLILNLGEWLIGQLKNTAKRYIDD